MDVEPVTNVAISLSDASHPPRHLCNIHRLTQTLKYLETCCAAKYRCNAGRDVKDLEPNEPKKRARDRTDIKYQASYLSSNIKNVQKLHNVSTEICCANKPSCSFSADKAKVLSLRQQTGTT